MRLIENISRRLLPCARIKYVGQARGKRVSGPREISRNDRATASIRSSKSFLVSPHIVNRHIKLRIDVTLDPEILHGNEKETDRRVTRYEGHSIHFLEHQVTID